MLVGTTSIETSEFLAGLLKKQDIAHEVLNAKQHEREAHIVAQAGQPGAVTIATNMAGRGTDIELGGNLEAELADLVAKGESVDEARREARARRPGRGATTRWSPPAACTSSAPSGTSRAASTTSCAAVRAARATRAPAASTCRWKTTLMRIFGDPNRTKRLLQIAGMKEGEVIESGMLTRQIEKAQRKVESHNFDIRKQLLLFDDVANDQRKVVYHQRTEILGAPDLRDAVAGMREDSVTALIEQYVPRQAASGDWDLQGLAEAVLREFNTRVDPQPWVAENPEIDEASFRQQVVGAVEAAYEEKVARVGAEIMRQVERDVVLHVLDQHWRDHLAAMDYLRQGIHLRGYAQKDYRYEYKRESFELFTAMLERVKHEAASRLCKVEVRTQADIDREEAEQRERLTRALQAQHAEAHSALAAAAEADAAAAAFPGAPAAGGGEGPAPFVRVERKVGRNEPCPCGSGKKFKHCHGAITSG